MIALSLIPVLLMAEPDFSGELVCSGGTAMVKATDSSGKVGVLALSFNRAVSARAEGLEDLFKLGGSEIRIRGVDTEFTKDFAGFRVLGVIGRDILCRSVLSYDLLNGRVTVSGKSLTEFKQLANLERYTESSRFSLFNKMPMVVLTRGVHKGKFLADFVFKGPGLKLDKLPLPAVSLKARQVRTDGSWPGSRFPWFICGQIPPTLNVTELDGYLPVSFAFGPVGVFDFANSMIHTLPLSELEDFAVRFTELTSLSLRVQGGEVVFAPLGDATDETLAGATLVEWDGMPVKTLILELLDPKKSAEIVSGVLRSQRLGAYRFSIKGKDGVVKSITLDIS